MTFDQIISSVRNIINDVDGVRWSDSDLLEYANEGVIEIKRVRPDLFWGTYSQSVPVYIGTDEFPLDREYEAFCKDYMIHRSHSREEEYINDGRALAFLGRFRQGLLQA